ncbi:bifunctional diaminohydroxyphosphoribosylaminopyrimidine deaminase/5-amino-6-(5-phosphoribosylamino)uracil reductase RibD [Pontibacter sp. SGAir0037]|uniref:bifunctional diaminohydroxyphosphoribosylaminopyrimidine deaminase/5-amino-6-(5-phosphoribosylamino)uracil reductase RibD n=1 Tax=Pontibacter sp. SGAir0037 TaxID=2571030 RepID=UPI0010CD118F|nr:bifunctional diaminohydroxyphosphoribosylaminopyrimidine deaminase/5-amino-6-(5-phosphoribosylamino)uracil reductase RibD [Pontibacter sp. SGAir0037]QCR24102.1 bifunctional diaminohydroxyphosphoribosylaminopyrimidine deaminase/5-amino-6-(5-phosphoribosylamino)uracil reductase RibD [Pontibacter sp. SGAir0037]
MSDKLYMQRALDLARIGSGYTSPNPMVGCVIVHEGQIIGEGWHRQYGAPHAEVNAVASVEDKSLLPKSRVYVTLEPCSHYGKTPPCADLLISHGIKDVVICNTDPNPVVAGRGIKKLFEAGAQVKVGILEEEGLELNKRFFTFHAQKRPYIILKWAETADGFVAGPNCEQVQISGKLAQRLVHKWRSEEQAIMVGTRTAIFDNPRLNTRLWSGKNPLRIVIDRQLQLPEQAHLFDKSQPTVVYNYKKQDQEHENLRYVLMNEQEPLLRQMMQDLYQHQILSVMVEGGTYLLNSLLEESLWDEANVFKSAEKMLGEGIKAPIMAHQFLHTSQTLGSDVLFHYKKIVSSSI